MQNKVCLLNLVSASRDLANRAGLLIRNVFETGNLKIIDKSMKIQKELYGEQGLKANDPQTIADIAAQKLISSSLLNTFPGISVIGEEDVTNSIHSIKPLLNLPEIYYKNDLYSSYLSGNYNKIINKNLNNEDICIWIDPIDGTKEYTEGIKNAVTCLIGISYKGQPMAGIINRPFSNETIFGFVDIPCLFFEKRQYIENMEQEQIESISILSCDDFKSRDSSRRIVCCSRSHLDDKITKYINDCKPDLIIKQGGCGGKILMILEGYADSYVHISGGTKKWDTCAPQAILQCIGGKLTEPNGNELDYSYNTQYSNSNGIIATWSKHIHESYCLMSS